MTDRIKVNAMDNDETKWPSWTAQGATTYAEAGVDTAEGARAVDAIKDAVHRTYRDEVRGDIGGFGGLFSINVAKNMADPILVSGTDGVGTKIQLAKLAGKHDTVGIDCPCSSSITLPSENLRAKRLPKSFPALLMAARCRALLLSVAKWLSILV